MKTLKIAALLIALVSLTSCSSMKFQTIDRPIAIGDKTYTALLTERVQPWGTNAVSLNLIESGNYAQQQPQPRYIYRGQPDNSKEMNYRRPAPCVQQYAEPLTNTHVASSNNQGSNGWASGAFQGSVGDAMLGAGMMGAGALIRPSHISVKGGAGGSSSAASSSSSSAAAAASAP